MNKYPVWLDCDVGVDDAIAIMALHALEETDLLAISTVSGNVPLSSTFSNAHRMNGLMKTNYPVYKGADRPLIVQPQYAYTFHGKNGLGDVELPLPEDAKMLDTPAWDALYDCAKQHPGELRLIAIGPLTNVAIALTKYPELRKLLHTILNHGRRGSRRQRDSGGGIQHLRGPRRGADRLQVRCSDRNVRSGRDDAGDASPGGLGRAGSRPAPRLGSSRRPACRRRGRSANRSAFPALQCTTRAP